VVTGNNENPLYIDLTIFIAVYLQWIVKKQINKSILQLESFLQLPAWVQNSKNIFADLLVLFCYPLNESYDV